MNGIGPQDQERATAPAHRDMHKASRDDVAPGNDRTHEPSVTETGDTPEASRDERELESGDHVGGEETGQPVPDRPLLDPAVDEILQRWGPVLDRLGQDQPAND